MHYFRQSTASQEVLLGPFVDDTDGKTAETGLTIANTDIKIHVAGATTLASKNSGGATHISNGNYYAVLDATDTATIGSGAIVVQVSGALAFRLNICILDEAVYDAWFGTTALATATNITSATGVDITKILGTTISTPATAGILDVNVKNIDNDAASASGTVTFPNATLASTTNITAGTITTVTNLTNAPTSGDFTSTMKTSIGTAVAASAVASVTGNVGGNVTGSVGSVVGAVGSVTGNVGGNVTGTIGGLTAAALKDFFDTDTTTTYASAVAGSVVKEIADNAGGSSLTVQDIVDGVWDEAQSGHTTSGTFGKYLDAAVSGVSTGGVSAGDIADAVWDEVCSGHTTNGTYGKAFTGGTTVALAQGVTASTVSDKAGYALTSAYDAAKTASSQTSVDDLPTNSELATALASADDAVLAAIAALNNVSTAQVKAQVVAALATDTYATPSVGAPPDSATLIEMLNYHYRALINKTETDNSEIRFYADNGTTELWARPHSVSAGTLTQGPGESG